MLRSNHVFPVNNPAAYVPDDLRNHAWESIPSYYKRIALEAECLALELAIKSELEYVY